VPDAGAAEGSISSGDAGLTSDGGDGVTDPGTQGDGTFMLAQPFTPSPDVSDQPGVPKGQIIMFTMANSTTFNDGSRKVAVYVPAGYVSGTVVPFMVAQDGVTPQNGGSFGLDDLSPTMDNMIAAKQIPMMAGIFADPGAMRSVEYDTVSDKYYQFVETELLPAAIAQVQMQANLTLNLTTDPEGRGTFGGSSGGSAAFTMGWFHPESYRRILTISGSFVNLQSSPQYPDGAADYAYANTPNTPAAADQHLIVNTTPPKPLRVFLEAGTNDLGGGEWKAANDAMAPAFAMENYHYRYVIAQGATHEDDAARRDYLPDAMAWLWRGYPITTP
jgi:iron(III)-enterobactin esterase